MNNDELKYLLIDYVEGTLDPSIRKEVEEYLRESKSARKELAHLQAALLALQRTDEEHIPHNYFNNLLPRIRQRIDIKKKNLFPDIFSNWLLQIRALPGFSVAVSFIIVLTLVGAFTLFNPRNDVAGINTIIAESDQNDIIQFSNSDGSIVARDEGAQLDVVSEIFSAHYGVKQLHQKLFASDDLFSALQSTTSYSDVEPLVTTLSDDEISLMMEKIDTPTN